MMQLPEDFDSIFRYIVVVSQRAEQLINGARPRVDSRHRKSTLIAKDDVDRGTVTWRILTQEEIDAQRQAIVDQFRAEVGGEEGAEAKAPIPDVLPTGASAVEAVDEEAAERDDEIARLQRLLGMAGASAEADDDDSDSEGDDGSDSDGDSDGDAAAAAASAADGGDALDLDEDDDDSGDAAGDEDSDGDSEDDDD